MTKKPEQDAPGLPPDEIAAWLEENPDFFVGRDDLLVRLQLPHKHGDAISLVERQVGLLRERNRDLRQELDALLVAARRNNEIFEICRKLLLDLVEARDRDAFFRALENGFQKEFRADAYSLIVFSDYANQVNHFTSSVSEASAREYVGSLIDDDTPWLGVLKPGAQDFLFRHASAQVRSAAVLPVKTDRLIALLAIGSSDPNYFKPGMGTLFIGFIADALARLLPRHVYLDPPS